MSPTLYENNQIEIPPNIRNRDPTATLPPPTAKTPAAGSKSASTPTTTTTSPQSPRLRIRQLERNIVFMRQQHLELLKSLQEEVETLKRKNNELQFQLVMQDLAVGERKGDIIGGERPQEVKIIQGSAAEEIKELESCLLSLQAELHEAKSRNIFLAELIEQQKRKLLEWENSASSSATTASTSTVSTVVNSAIPRGRSEAEDKLKEMEQMAALLKTENDNLKRELSEAKMSKDQDLRYRGCNHPKRLHQRRQSQNNNSPQRQQLQLQQQQQQQHLGPRHHHHHRSNRTESLDRFPPLSTFGQDYQHHHNNNRGVRSQQQNNNNNNGLALIGGGSELPPVPGSSGSDGSILHKEELRKSPLRKPQPINLITLNNNNNNHNKSVRSQQHAKKANNRQIRWRL